MNYNYVIFGAAADFHRVSYRDIQTCDFAKYLYRHIDSSNKLLKDNPEIEHAPLYRPELISTFRDARDIDAEFVKREPYAVNYGWKE